MSVMVKKLIIVVVASALMMSAPPSATAFSSLTISTFPSRLQSIHLSINPNLSDSDDMESSSFDMEELRKRMDQQMNQYHDLFMNEDAIDEVRPDHVYIVVFNPDNDAEQGVHTIEFPKGSGDNIILAFESNDECIQFSQMLKNMQFYNPVPQMANLSELQVFCKDLGVPVKVVPRGKDLRPPADNVNELSMNPNLRQDKHRLNRAFMVSDDKEDDRTGDVESVWE